jgi:bacterioferritin
MEKNSKIVDVLNHIVELELAGAVRYTQYSLMVFGHGRIPITNWMREKANEALMHAVEAGEEVTSRGGRVSLALAEATGVYHDHVDDIMKEMLVHERQGIGLYRQLLEMVTGSEISLEEFARQKIRNEEVHVSEIEKMFKRRGDA